MGVSGEVRRMWLRRLMFAGLALLLAGVASPPTIATAAAQSPPSLADIRVRDGLIADQEALLNAYRCLFDIDIEVVPGGCDGDQPARPAREPVPYAAMPTPGDLAVRDGLIADQEALLNAYRCLFDIDTEVVPGGCVGGVPAPAPDRVPNWINVSAAPPSGRCAQAVASGLLAWESCAWEGFWDDQTYNYSLSEAEGQSLLEKIWTEVDVEGKSANPPTSELATAGATCATAVEGGVIGACYQQSKHSIRRLDSFLQTLLHETAHSLVAAHPSMQACQSHSDPRDYDTCAHGDVFRCVADHLFVRYGGIPSAGVCGTTEQQTAQPNYSHEWVSAELAGGGRIAGVSAHLHNRGFPYGDSDDWLFVRCKAGRLDVYLSFERGTVAGQPLNADRVPVTLVYLPGAFFKWDEAIQDNIVASSRIRGLWGKSADNDAVSLPEGDQLVFINAAVNTNRSWLMASVEDGDGTEFGTFVFDLENAPVHVRPVAEACGMTLR